MRVGVSAQHGAVGHSLAGRHLAIHSPPIQRRSPSGGARTARASSPARHSGHRQRPAGSSRSAGSVGISRHQHSNGFACMPQSKALPQRGQRALLSESEADGFMTAWTLSRRHRSGNDATTGRAPGVVRSANSQTSSKRGTLALVNWHPRPVIAQCAMPVAPSARAGIENPVAARQSCTIRPVLTVPCLSLPPCPSFPTFRRSRPP